MRLRFRAQSVRKPADSRATSEPAAALQQGKSLLPAGVSAVSGLFERGDPVRIQDAQGYELGQGLSCYSSHEAQAIMGRQSREIEAILGYSGRAALIHRDDMAI